MEEDREFKEEDLPHPKNERKFIVFESCQRELVSVCPGCQRACTVAMDVAGSALSITCFCKYCNETWHWASQPKIQQMYAGSFIMSAIILFSGALASKILRFLDSFRIVRVARSTHFRRRKKEFACNVHGVWDKEQQDNMQVLSDRDDLFVLAGDGRSDSPGHSAKYGGHNLQECIITRVVDVQVVQVCI